MRFLAVLAIVLALFGSVSALQMANPKLPANAFPSNSPFAKLNLNSYSGMQFDAGTLPPSPYQLDLIAEKATFESYSNIEAGKIISASKDSVLVTHKLSSSNSTFLYLYTLSNGAIPSPSMKSMKFTGRNTRVYSVTYVPGHYKFMLGGHYDYTSSVSYPILAFAGYSDGGLSTPSYWGISPVSDSYVVDTDAGDVTGDGSADYVLLLQQENSSNDFIRLTVRKTSNSATVVVGSKYAGGSWPKVKIGKFTAASVNDMVVIGDTGSQTDLLLYRLGASNSIAKLASKYGLTTASGKKIYASHLEAADLDGDGDDELILSGSYAIGFLDNVDVTQVYRYGTNGWEKKNEYVKATSGSSNAVFASVADVDSDGQKEIISVSRSIYSKADGNTAGKIRVNVFKYNPSGADLLLLSSHDITAPAAEDGYWPQTAALGDFDADGKQDLAIHYLNIETDGYKLGMYSIGRDVYPPNITVQSPYYSNYSNVGKLPIRFYAYDAGELDASSFKAKLTGPGNYDSGYKPYALNHTNGEKGIVYNSSVSIAGLPAGNYTVNYEVSDKAGNKKIASKKISIYAASAPATFPNVTLYSPLHNSWFYDNSSIPVKFQAYDADGINMSSMKAKLTNANYTSGLIGGIISWSPYASKARNYTANISLAGMPPGKYTLYLYAFDAKGYGVYKYIYVYVFATPTAQAPAPAPETQAAEPAADMETPVEPAQADADAPSAVEPEMPAVEAPEPETPAAEPEAAVDETAADAQTPALGEETPALGEDALGDAETPPAAEPETETGTPDQQPSNGTSSETSEGQQIATPPAAPGGVQAGGQQANEPSASGEESTMAAQASRLTGELEVKIEVAKRQGITVSSIEPSVARSKALQQQGKYVEAALEAQAATALLDEKLAGNAPIKPLSQQGFYLPCPVAPMLISSLLLFALVAERRREKK